MAAIQSFITDAEGLLLAVSGSLAVIGFLGVGAMYLMSSLPVVSEWKQNNPKAFNNVVIGLVLVMFAGGGGVAVLLGT